MIKTIYNIIKKRDYDEICNFLDKALKVVSSDGVNEGYYISNTTEYELTPTMVIETSMSFDIFGANKTGGKYINIVNYETEESLTMFSHNITSINGEYVENDITICEEKDLLIYEENYKKGSTYTEETFLTLLNNLNENTIAYWKKLPLEVRIKTEYVEKIMNYYYEKAIIKREEIVAYDNISPYGGLDITYYPCSNGECFYDMAIKLVDFIDMKKKEYVKYLINYIKEKDKEDAFVIKYEKEKEMFKNASKNPETIKEDILLYFSAERRHTEIIKGIAKTTRRRDECESNLKELEKEIAKLKSERELLLNKRKYALSDFASATFYILFGKCKKDKMLESKISYNLKELLSSKKALEKEYEWCNRTIAKYIRKKQKNNCILKETQDLSTLFLTEMFPNDDYTIMDGIENTIPMGYYNMFVEKMCKKYAA